MTSIIAWLDTSADEQRRVRELIALFAQTESRDELGIGQIRDVFSDALFPGTSVIQTRARYFLFVPWVFRDGAQRRLSGPKLKAWTDQRERRLIEALRQAGESEGLIGRRAGPAVKILPSAIYWSGLTRYGILTRDAAPDQLQRVVAAGPADGADELATRVQGDWAPTLPAPPAEFPESVEGGFAMPRHEAAWLREQMMSAAPGTLLAHLLGHTDPPDPDSGAPWEDTACLAAPTDVRSLLRHAELFSLAVHGAALLYNLLLGERYESAGHTRVAEPADSYRDRIDEWAKECADLAAALSAWDRDEFWSLVLRSNPRISLATRLFVNAWLDAICSGRASAVADDQVLRDLVARRERQQKKGQSRLSNERLLRTWSGASGSAQLTYRWSQVRRILTDIHAGLGHDAGA
ncbi:DUF6361 family protein [Planosporangium mesophilum]|uniref:Uncharacterized protein n=1 Tax=Planosporangium mesophilum TaxID=689768 RepID=A0A8J3X385_9ACTN|nr:DUF6361 family protein [Planosporangium mesophilum]NJC86207.1 hypothetical protein [Planosporangium mesophilum]GII25701.1 hypothetical protein Pme01_52980 [Planosporangium mesophilum]